MEELILIAIFAGLVGGWLIVAGILAVRRKRRAIARITREYGQIPVWKGDERDLASMREYHALFPPAAPSVDDVTWHDLDMDRVFLRLKNTQSSVGDEVAYRHLRTQQNPALAHFEEATAALSAQPDARLALQYAFSRIGRKTGNGLAAMLLAPGGFPPIPLLLITLLSLVGVGSIALCFFFLDIGVLALSFSFMAAIILFYYVLHKINTAMEILGMFTRVLRAARLIVKLNLPALAPERATLQAALKSFQRTGALMDFLLHCSAIGKTGQGGNLFTMVLAYFGIYAFAYTAMVRQFARHTAQIRTLYETVGLVEVYISTASYRQSLAAWCPPTFTQDSRLDFANLVHPLLRHPVPNSRRVHNKLIITGSNASGKSTFAKTLALNVLLGQQLGTCLATHFSFRPANVFTSMNLEDDITKGDSFYVAEIKSLKRLMRQAEKPAYSMLFLDEIFKGTNMVERIAAAAVILEHLAGLDCFVCLATHDTELCAILGARYKNYHFREEVTADDILFDYTLYEGVTTGSNAIKLLAHCGYSASLTRQAEAYAESFRQTGAWQPL